MSRFRLSIGPGQFFVVLAEGGTIGTLSPVQVQARGRFTPG